ncbi:hypothetical protein [Spongiactinospora sp. 9N601]|uniref:hypothetical protein n=1 Tax=Spongiactinospora sp. 9N601 TaxID=3375149 RepID=UPI0037902C42
MTGFPDISAGPVRLHLSHSTASGKITHTTTSPSALVAHIKHKLSFDLVADRIELGEGGPKDSCGRLRDMTSERESTPSDESHEPPPQHHRPGPLEHEASLNWTPPPRTVSIASTLWICYGAILAISTILYFLNPRSAPLYTGSFTLFLLAGYGVVLIVLAKLMRRGNAGARIALTVLGALTLFGIWTALFIVPAIVLQFLTKSNAWFQAVNAPVADQ